MTVHTWRLDRYVVGTDAARVRIVRVARSRRNVGSSVVFLWLLRLSTPSGPTGYNARRPALLMWLLAVVLPIDVLFFLQATQDRLVAVQGLAATWMARKSGGTIRDSATGTVGALDRC